MDQTSNEYTITIPCPIHPQRNVEYLCTNHSFHQQRLYCATCVFQSHHCKHDGDIKDFRDFIYEQQQQFYRSGLQLAPDIFELLDSKDQYLGNFKEQAQRQADNIEQNFEVLIHKVVNILNSAKEELITTLEKCVETYACRYQTLHTKVVQNFQNTFFVSKFKSFDEMAQNFMPFTLESVSLMISSLIENYPKQCTVPDDITFAFENVMSIQESNPTFDLPRFDTIKSQIHLLVDKLQKISSTLITTTPTEWRPHVVPTLVFDTKKQVRSERTPIPQRTRSQVDIHSFTNRSQNDMSTNMSYADHQSQSATKDSKRSRSSTRLYGRLPRLPAIPTYSMPNSNLPEELERDSNKHQTEPVNFRCLKEFNTEHTRTVFSVVNIGNNHIATASDDGLIKVWDLDVLSCVAVLKGHNAGVRSLALLGNRNLVSGSWDRNIKIWNTGRIDAIRDAAGDDQQELRRSGDLTHGQDERESSHYQIQCVNTLKGHINSVLCVGVLPDGQTIMSGSTDCSIKLWSSLSGSLLKTMTGHSNEVVCLAATKFSPNVISGSGDKTIKVWNYEKKSVRPCVRTLVGHSGFIWSIELLGDDCTLVSGSLDRVIRIWNIESGDCLKVLAGHNSQVLLVKQFRENRLVSVDAEGVIKIWNVQKWNLITTVKKNTDKQAIYCLTALQDNTILVSGANKKIAIWG